MSREEIDAEIEKQWPTIFDSRELKQKLVIVPNLFVLRYKLGVREATRTLLQGGGLETVWHNKDSVATHQLVLSTELLLLKPIEQLLLLGKNIMIKHNLADAPIFRPKYRKQIRFLIGHDDDFDNTFKQVFAERVASTLKITLKSDSLLTDPDEICLILADNPMRFDEPFSIVNLEDRDKLQALCGREKADDMLAVKAHKVISKLVQKSKETCPDVEECPFAKIVTEFPNLFENIASILHWIDNDILPVLRSLTDIFSQANDDAIAFFLGPRFGYVVAKNGPEHELTLEALPDEEGAGFKQKGKVFVRTKVWDAFKPNKERLEKIFQEVTRRTIDQLDKSEI
jgi:hypothetical protein